MVEMVRRDVEMDLKKGQAKVKGKKPLIGVEQGVQGEGERSQKRKATEALKVSERKVLKEGKRKEKDETEKLKKEKKELDELENEARDIIAKRWACKEGERGGVKKRRGQH